MEGRWARGIGILAPAAWLVMAFATGMLGAAVRQLFRVSEGAGMTNLISLISGVTAFLSLLMIVACGRHWFREYAGLGKSLNTFAVSFVIVAVCYTHPRYLVLAPHPRFRRLGTELGAASRSPAFGGPGSFLRPIEGGRSRRKAVILRSRTFAKT